ncbi:hypothetical protein [Nostoc sp.]|uniref:hypothetical protein n=2 Tax=Nostoc sp. TaxID=1180 RepID=UPI002FF4A6A1
MGHGEESQCPMPNAQCPKSAGSYPSPPTKGWSFPPTFNKSLLVLISQTLKQSIYDFKKVVIITYLLGKALLVTASDSGSG